jgi:hypothetical protein
MFFSRPFLMNKEMFLGWLLLWRGFQEGEGADHHVNGYSFLYGPRLIGVIAVLLPHCFEGENKL